LFYEFFAGAGMARAGLGIGWNCIFANDFDDKKADSYRSNWPGGSGNNVLVTVDVGKLTTIDLPGIADLAWASFPCQDLSLAGAGAGLKGARSGTFWPFWRLIEGLRAEGRAPKLIVLENVCGTLTSHGGNDFRSLIQALSDEGYRAGALVIDAAYFVPQSRPRLFIVGVSGDIEIAPHLIAHAPQRPFHTTALVGAYRTLSQSIKEEWIWWHLPVPNSSVKRLPEILDEDVGWHTPAQTNRLIELMSPVHRAKLSSAIRSGARTIGTIYKRTRPDDFGVKRQRAEIRFDEVAGCLRTPGGGSSRQTIIVVEGKKVRSRLLSTREAARLMGLPESYILPQKYNDAYHLMGDGVVVPVVRHLACQILEPLLQNTNGHSDFPPKLFSDGN
jgi:DNA (cytosine-5)-methyltransferase 1